MERIVLTDSNVQAAAEVAAVVLRRGGVVLYPTDTLYGLGVDALSDAAVDKIVRIKGRDEGKPIHAIVEDMHMAAEYASVSGFARLLDDKLPKGKITFVTQKKDTASRGIGRVLPTFGFRIPDYAFCLEMLRAFAGPITATSANRAGEPPQNSPDAILAQLGETSHLIDVVIDAGELPVNQPSTVIDLTHDHPLILREAAVSAADVWDAIRN